MQFISMTPPARDAGGVMLRVNSVPGFSSHEPMKYSLWTLLLKQPFKNSDDAASLVESLRLAGLPD
jgi:hypothetical protein